MSDSAGGQQCQWVHRADAFAEGEPPRIRRLRLGDALEHLGKKELEDRRGARLGRHRAVPVAQKIDAPLRVRVVGVYAEDRLAKLGPWDGVRVHLESEACGDVPVVARLDRLGDPCHPVAVQPVDAQKQPAVVWRRLVVGRCDVPGLRVEGGGHLVEADGRFVPPGVVVRPWGRDRAKAPFSARHVPDELVADGPRGVGVHDVERDVRPVLEGPSELFEGAGPLDGEEALDRQRIEPGGAKRYGVVRRR